MTVSESQPSSQARVTLMKSLSPIWLVPLVAAGIGIWMVVTTLSNQGELITLTLDNAEGIEAGKTPIKARSVQVGQVQTVRLSEDLSQVTVTARLSPEATPLLRDDSRFWVVKPRIGKSGISGLGTLLSGAYIELQPGQSAEARTEFDVLDSPPITAADAPGLRIELSSELDEALSVGDPILYRGFTVGRVEQAEFDTAKRQMRYQLFINAPYDGLVTSNVRFWLNSGVQFKAASDGFRVQIGSMESILVGGISFDVPSGWSLGKPVVDHRVFSLYADQESITGRQYKEYVDYLLLFDESVRGLISGASVEYRGVPVGRVLSVPYSGSGTDLLSTSTRQIPVLIRIEPGRLSQDLDKDKLAAWEQEFEGAIRQGLRAALRTGSLLTGALYVDLNFYPEQPPVSGFGQLAEYRTLPTVSGGLARIEQQVVSLLDKLNRLQLEPVLANTQSMLKESERTLQAIRQLSGSVDKLAAQSATQKLPAELRQTLQDLQQSLQALSSNSPAYSELNRSMESLNSLLQELKPVARSLSEKPNALIFDSGSSPDPQPRKAQ